MLKRTESVNRRRRVLTGCAYFFVIVSAMLLVPVALPQMSEHPDGSLDATFGAAGKVKTDFSGQFVGLTSMAIQPDGKIIAVGYTQDSNGPITLTRYNRDGSLDASFGSGGKVLRQARQFEAAFKIALLPDGKMLVGGSARGVGQDFGVARFNSDGSLDTAFGDDGVVISNIGGADYVADLKVQPDGKILAAGFAQRTGLQASSFAVIRYKSQGGLDKTFGNSGLAKVEFSDGFDFLFDMALQPDGKIVLAGGTDSNDGTAPWGLARLNSDGSLDAGFGNGGKTTTRFTDFQCEAHAVVIQPDGKIIVAGESRRELGIPHILAIARYESNGSLDMTFGSGGKATYDFGGRGGLAQTLALQRDGKILAAGAVGNLNANLPQVDFAVVRYNKDGSFDSSFGNGGVALTDLGNVVDVANAMVLQPDGKIVLGGSSGTYTDLSDMVLARYNNDSLAFDNCIQDDSNGNLLQFNTATGDYKFTACASGLTLSGKAAIKVKSCKTKIQADAADHHLAVTIKTCNGKASATFAVTAGQTFTITDSQLSNNTCACP